MLFDSFHPRLPSTLYGWALILQNPPEKLGMVLHWDSGPNTIMALQALYDLPQTYLFSLFHPFMPLIIHRIIPEPQTWLLLSLFYAFTPYGLLFRWNVLSFLTISVHSSLKTQLKCQLIFQPDVIFTWVPTTLPGHLTSYIILWICRGNDFQSRYR